MSIAFIEVLGKQRNELKVVNLIREFSLTEVSDAPPSRQYVGAKSRGVDLIFEDGRISCVQVYLKSGQGFSAYSGDLPYGIRADMNQVQINALLGTPARQDATYSSFLIRDQGVKVAIDFDSTTQIKLLSLIAIPAR
jgi:hypothetical protein